jgi:hypothetical protein
MPPRSASKRALDEPTAADTSVKLSRGNRGQKVRIAALLLCMMNNLLLDESVRFATALDPWLAILFHQAKLTLC